MQLGHPKCSMMWAMPRSSFRSVYNRLQPVQISANGSSLFSTQNDQKKNQIMMFPRLHTPDWFLMLQEACCLMLVWKQIAFHLQENTRWKCRLLCPLLPPKIQSPQPEIIQLEVWALCSSCPGSQLGSDLVFLPAFLCDQEIAWFCSQCSIYLFLLGRDLDLGDRKKGHVKKYPMLFGKSNCKLYHLWFTAISSHSKLN